MQGTIHEVRERVERIDWASAADFVLGPGQPADPFEIANDPAWTLYTIDVEGGRAGFVQLPEGTDLSRHAFVRDAQLAGARRYFDVPVDILPELAAALRGPEHIIYVFSIGRCGSTLVHNILNSAPGVWSLSEPDVYTRLVNTSFNHPRFNFPPGTLAPLIAAIDKLLFRPPPGMAATTYAVKFRSQLLIHAEAFHAAAPDAAFVFMYREALGWARSVYEMLRKFGIPDPLTGDDRTIPWNVVTASADPALLAPYVDLDAEAVPLELPLMAGWAVNMDEYQRQLAAGVPFMALRYEELKAGRLGSLEALFDHCGLPKAAVGEALAAFEADSQAGTPLARDVEIETLDEARRTRMSDLLSRQPRHNDPGLMLPDIYSSRDR